MKGKRIFKLEVSKMLCEFSEDSLIQFFNENDDVVFSMDPTELSLIYGAYRQMEKEMAEDKNDG